MKQKIVQLFLLVLLVSCGSDYPEPLESCFDRLEEIVKKDELETFKNSDVLSVFENDIFEYQLDELFADTNYHQKCRVLFDTLDLLPSEFFEPYVFLKCAFHYKLNGRSFDWETMQKDYYEMERRYLIAKENYTLTDAEFLLERVVLNNLSHLRLKDTLDFVLPIKEELVFFGNGSVPADDTFKLKGIVVDEIREFKSKKNAEMRFYFKLIKLDRDYLIDNKKYDVGDTIVVSLDMTLKE